jgi:hypothetical protein
MFRYPKFDVTTVRKVEPQELGWPAPGEAGHDSGLGCNRMYADLRRLSWAEAKRVFALEGSLIARMESAADTADEWAAIEDELSESDQDLYGLDPGVASTVVSLSAAKCVPFSSCNAGAFGEHHQERYPLVAFYARAQAVDLLAESAEEAAIGLEGNDYLVAYADDIRKIREFARSLIRRSPLFNAIRTRRSPQPKPKIKEDQYRLALE